MLVPRATSAKRRSSGWVWASISRSVAHVAADRSVDHRGLLDAACDDVRPRSAEALAHPRGADRLVVLDAAVLDVAGCAYERVRGAGVADEGRADRAGVHELDPVALAAEGQVRVAEDQPPGGHAPEQLGLVAGRLWHERAQVRHGRG